MKYISSLKRNKSKYSERGFTLIEMLVSVGLFSVVMLVSVAAILSIIGNNKKAQGINNVVNNLNFAIESMVRDMKTGYLYKCSYSWPISQGIDNLCPSSTSPVDKVAFVSTLSGTPTAVEYSFVAPTTDGSGVYTPGHIVKRTAPSNNFVDLTSSSDVDIQSIKMYVSSPAPGAGTQPGIFLIISGKANILENEVTEFGLQTFISQRILNL
ncbi:MAG: type II secretion system GspH family protein [Candidatus Pacebacteria bacterium]|nr:type II secretion system GspH family protein [Candidatus Paceibacterota bacterium]